MYYTIPIIPLEWKIGGGRPGETQKAQLPSVDTKNVLKTLQLLNVALET